MPPNFLFIIADDLNAWIGALGRHPQAHTPNIDALAARATLFVNAYCSAPYCNASRMGLFTGCLPSTLGVYQNEAFWDAPNRRATFIELLKHAGYYTFGAGKVFHGVFDYASAGEQGASTAAWKDLQNRDAIWDSFVSNQSEPLPARRSLNGLYDFADFANVPDKYHHFDWGPLPNDVEETMPDSINAKAVADFLQDPPTQPFFCAMGVYKPHLPWHVPQRFFDILGNRRIATPLVKDDDLDDVPPIAKAWANDPPDHELITSRGEWENAVRGYLSCMSYADDIVGRVLAALDRSPARDNTVVILCGDNGFHLGEKLHWRKFALWEEATRVPLIVASPGAPPQRSTTPVSLIDIFPTLLDLAGLEQPQSDAIGLFTRADADPAPIMTWGRGNHSLRSGRLRYTRYSDGSDELYDLATDPNEWTNLSGQAAFQRIRHELGREIASRCDQYEV